MSYTTTASFIMMGIMGVLIFYKFVTPMIGKKGVQEGRSAQLRPLPLLDTPHGLVNPISYQHQGNSKYSCVISTGNHEQTISIDESQDYLEPKNSKVESIFGSGAQQWEWKPYGKDIMPKQQQTASIIAITQLQEKNESLEAEKKLAETTSDLQLDKKVEDAAALAKAGKQPAQRFGQR